MRRKLSTILEENLVRRAKLEAVRQGKPLSELITEAIEGYLRQQGSPAGAGEVVRRSWRAIAVDRDQVVKILENEGSLLED